MGQGRAGNVGHELLAFVAACAPTSAAGHNSTDQPECLRVKMASSTWSRPLRLSRIWRHVAGDRARVTGLIPSNADPHTHELTLRDVRNIANADIAFSNGLLLEPQPVLRSLHNSSLPGTPVVSVAEQATTRGATVVPLVENLALDTVWLGLRSVSGSGG